MFLIALIILIWYCAKHDILSISNYPHIEKLFKKLKEKHTDIVEETKKWIDNKSFSNKKRKPGVWDATDLKDEWIYGWNNDNLWFNYPLVYNKELCSFVDTKSIIYSILNDSDILSYINVCGFSLLKANGHIETHRDELTTYNKGKLVFHYNIFGNNSNIIINNIKHTQIPGEYLIFDSDLYHSVEAGNEDRLILYVDFSIK